MLFGVFLYQFYHLSLWTYQFELNRNQELRMASDSSVYKARRLWVAPWVCGFYIVNDDGTFKHLVFIFDDMLSYADYRHLCRLLLSRED